MENNGFKNHPYCNPYRRNFRCWQRIPLIYLDSAATARSPPACCRRSGSLTRYNANPMRGFYALSVEATERVEEARKAVRRFLNARLRAWLFSREIPRKA